MHFEVIPDASDQHSRQQPLRVTHNIQLNAYRASHYTRLLRRWCLCCHTPTCRGLLLVERSVVRMLLEC